MALRLADLRFDRPADLVARGPAEERGLERDEVRLLVSTGLEDHRHARFLDLASFLDAGDLLVVNQSATIPAALDATGPDGEFLLDCCTDYGGGLWLTEPRVSASEPGPLSLSPGDRVVAGGLEGRVVAAYPGIERLLFVRFAGDLRATLEARGRPIRYGYVSEAFSLSAYQTLFAAEPGSAEMPSAARPFTERVLTRLRARGVGVAPVTLHAGVSSLEVEADQCGLHCSPPTCSPLYPEPFRVPASTARAVNRTRRRGGRVVAVGTTVVRALESAYEVDPTGAADVEVETDAPAPAGRVVAAEGFTRRFVTPETGVRVVDGLLTGFHDPETTHLAMLYAVADRDQVMAGYDAAVDEGYRWHEFGDSHLLLPGDE